jgi:hypothetical protein
LSCQHSFWSLSTQQQQPFHCSENDFGYKKKFTSTAEKKSAESTAIVEPEFFFRQQLNNFYKAKHDTSLKDAFRTEMNASGKTDPSTLWTSTFKCPISGVLIKAGKIPSNNELFRVEKDGQWFYSSKKISMQAVAMEALNQLCDINTTSINEENEEEELTSTTEQQIKVTTAKRKLYTWYMRNHKIGLRDDMFAAQKKSLTGKLQGGTWWTVSFTCPISGQVFQCTELQRTTGDGEATSSMHRDSDGRCWYRKKSDAIHAAAAHAIYIHKLEEKETIIPSINDNDDGGMGQDEYVLSESAIVDSTLPLSSTLTRAPLNTWYKKEHNLDISDDAFVASIASLKGKVLGGNWWTASFICPVSGDRYDSKCLLMQETNEQLFHQDSDEIVWYKKKEDSMIAAGLGALDMLRFQKTGAKEPRYCKEDPSETVQEEVDPSLRPNMIISVNEQDRSSTKSDGSGPMEEMPSISPGQKEIEDEEEYVIELVPQRLGSFLTDSSSSSAITATTLDLIADTWIKSTNISKSDSPRSLFHKPDLMRKEAIDRAYSWIALQQQDHGSELEGARTRFDGQSQTTNIKIANLILESLANTNWRVAVETKRYGVEEAANAVIDYMWSLKSTTPDATSYASFIKCLEGENSFTIAKKAQIIYDSMANGSEYKGRILPKPDIAVYNSLIQRLGGTGTNLSIPDLDSKMEPNRTTFLSMLSFMAHPPYNKGENMFDADRALEYIERMKALSNKKDFLEPDIQIYNAPLAWNGGLLSSSTRPYSRSIPWDSYDEIFRKGFKVLLQDHELLQEARNVESWYESIESEKFGPEIHPNIETLESLIQAWVRTSTRDGLEKAESIALNLIDNPSEKTPVRLQTFHPILSGWVYSGAKDSPEKVDYWLQRLSDLGLPVQYDGRYRAAPILARVSKQKQLLREYDVHELANQDTASDFHTVAVESSRYLEDMTRDYKNKDDFFLEADCFILAIQAWYNAGFVCSRMGDVNGSASALLSINKINKAFDGLVESLYSSDTKASLTQILHLLEASPRIYSATFSALREFDRNIAARVSDGESKKSSHLTKHLISLEQQIRRSEEFRLCSEEKLAKARAFDLEQDASYRGVYEDLFSFPSKQLVQENLSPTWFEFYKAVFQALEQSNIEPEKESDVARICVLVTDILKVQNAENEHSLNVAIIQILKKFRSNESEKRVLFDAIQSVYRPTRQKYQKAIQPSKDGKSGKGAGKVISGLLSKDPGSSRKNLNRRRRVQNNRSPQHRNKIPSQHLENKKQQAC